ncbi:MAG: FAD-binding oxidoreductase [Candidatus Zambryskibacteria bacterium CG10_big_fil_rev_8_21_14_0_10_42_12]|uniref:FAD-binding oxidoreductase n=1 Tax=Candidatus Zambryskibacteria bacterium CG10_big_fil_rev_8_21_14_0_10_42_12 TaxID=1975115 RepID=A0A2H0QVI9_9BACT|nr:MAG: FAD-binding oxidoreductase [Candidatus Zambryskibacteria bacterium CG10_big_fil_rev_8_21_14_0_10_42_12]
MRIKQETIDAVQKETGCEVLSDKETLDTFSKDTSLFKVEPSAVCFPKNVEEIKKIVRSVVAHKAQEPHLSITGRSGGSDMTGGPLTTGLVLSMTEHLNHFSIDKNKKEAIVEPGVFYRDFEKETEPLGLVYPAFPASRGLCAWGGMVMNNAAGEKTLRYGQTREHVRSVSMVLADGNEYNFGPLDEEAMKQKMREQTFEGDIYRRMHELVTTNYDAIEAATPRVTKNSSGYALARVWDKKKKIFDLSQLFVGSQGTLGIMTKAKVGLVEEAPHKTLIALFLPNWNKLPDLVNKLLPFEPESLETFDDATMKLGIRFMPEIARKVGVNFFSFALKFLPEALISIRMFGIPKLVMLVELAEKEKDELIAKQEKIEHMLRESRVNFRTLTAETEQDKYWVMRRESFNLLRQKVKGKRTAPFVEDFCVAPRHIPEFLPELLAILKGAGIKANIAGHAGNGNFHIIPLMDLTDPHERAKIVPVADRVYDLVIAYEGSITAEHNDGIIRTPYVKKQYGERVYKLFEETKNIFDPQNIFNPGKKVGGTKEDIEKYLA